MQEFPEQVGGVRICVARGSSGYAGVKPDEHAYEVGFEDILQLGKMGVSGRGSIANG